MNLRLRYLLPVLAVAASTASAHPGHDANGFVSGVAHPITGLDHLLAMVGVGVLSVMLGKRWVAVLPATFVAFMIAGAAAGAMGLFVPTWIAENGIALSVLLVGILIAAGAPIPKLVTAALVAVFAVCHGSAHAAEMPEGRSITAFFAGFTLATIALHAVGIAAGLMLAHHKAEKPALSLNFALRTCGIAIAATGALMIVGIL